MYRTVLVEDDRGLERKKDDGGLLIQTSLPVPSWDPPIHPITHPTPGALIRCGAKMQPTLIGD